jgi:hypothetical protein
MKKNITIFTGQPDPPSEEELRKTLQKLKGELKITRAGLTKSIAQIDILHSTQKRILSNMRKEYLTCDNCDKEEIKKKNNLSALFATSNAINAQRSIIWSNMEHTRHLLKANFDKRTKLRTRVPPFAKTSMEKVRTPKLPSRKIDPHLILRKSLLEKSTSDLIENWSKHKWSNEECELLTNFSNDSNEKYERDKALDLLCNALISRALKKQEEENNSSTTTTTNNNIPNTGKVSAVSLTLPNGESLEGVDHHWIHQLRSCAYVYDEKTLTNELILESSEDNIESATLNGIVQRLTHPSLPDLKMRFVFLLTYKSYITSHGLLALLIHRFFVPNIINEKTSSSIRTHFHKMIMAPIQIKVLSVIKSWLEDFYDDFNSTYDNGENNINKEDNESKKDKIDKTKNGKLLHTDNDVVPPTVLYDALEQFLIYIQVYASSCTGEWSTWTAEHLLKLLRRRKYLLSSSNRSRIDCLSRRNLSNRHKPPPSIVPPGGLHKAMFLPRHLISNHDTEKINTACLLSPIEVARQCTLVDHSLFCAIHINEFLCKKRTKELHAPNIYSMIQRFNQLNLWSVTNIVVNNELEDRIYVVEWTIDFISELILLNNYHAGLAIFSALTCSTITRLKQTINGISTKHKELLDSFRTSFSVEGKNKNLR